MASEKAQRYEVPPPPPYSGDQQYPQGYPQYPPAGGGYPYGQPPAGQYYPGPASPVQNISQTSTNVVVVGQPTTQSGIVYTTPAPNNYMGLAIFSCLCCFWPTGICAIVAASNSSSAAARGDNAGAISSASMARNLSIASIVVGVIWITLVVVLRAVVYSSSYYGY